MKTIIRAALAPLLALLLVGCGTSGKDDVRSTPNTNEGGTTASTKAGDGDGDGDGDGGSTTTTARSTSTEAKSAEPAAAQASEFVGGNVDPAFGPGEAGKLSVIAVGSPDGEEGAIPFVVRNNTGRAVYSVKATGKATSDGRLVGSGESQSVQPVVVAPGEIAFGNVYFSAAPPAGSTIEVSATADSKKGKFFGKVAMTVGEANLIAGEYSDQIVGEVTAPADVEVSGPVEVLVLCVDAAGTVARTPSGYTDGDASVLPGASATYSVDLYDACPTFLIGSSGYDE